MEIYDTSSFSNFSLQIIQHHILIEIGEIKFLIPTFVQFLRINQLAQIVVSQFRDIGTKQLGNRGFAHPRSPCNQDIWQNSTLDLHF